jgi:ABC-type transport system involved in multi-copper enzyme maturation permease subunit
MPAPRQPGRIIEAVPLVLVVGAVLAAPFVFAWWGTALYVAVGLLVAACAGLIMLAILRNWSPLVGPLFFYDLVRLARRGRGTALRFVYGAALLLALGFIYNRHFPGTDLLSLSGTGQWVSLREQAAFAQAFATTLLLAQNVAVLVLTPAYLAGAVAEEKEKKTLPLLFTTALTSREIIVGKMLGRLAHIGGVLLVALPVLSLAQLWGGVDLAVILAGCTVTALTLLSVGALSLFFSTTANTVLSALVGAYAASAALGLGCLCQGGGYAFSPISFVMELDRRISQGAEASAIVGTPTAPPPDSGDVALEMVSHYAVLHGGIAVIVVLGTIALLRPNDRPAGLRPAEGPVERPADGDQLPRMPVQPVGLHSSPPVGDDALFWKEVLYGTGPHAPRFREELVMPLAFTMIVSGVAWGVVGLDRLIDPYGAENTGTSVLLANIFNLLIRLSTVILLTLVCAAVAFRAVGAVARERARRTLDGLLTLPLPRQAILRAKWLGCVLRARILLYLAVAGWLLGVCTGAVHPLALLLLVLITAAHLAFLTSLGLCVSLATRSIPWAYFIMLLLLLVFFFSGQLGWLCYRLMTVDESGDPAEAFFRVGLNPWRAWWTLTFPWAGGPQDGGLQWEEVPALAAAPVMYAVAAAVLWLQAVHEFRCQQGRDV